MVMQPKYRIIAGLLAVSVAFVAGCTPSVGPATGPSATAPGADSPLAAPQITAALRPPVWPEGIAIAEAAPDEPGGDSPLERLERRLAERIDLCLIEADFDDALNIVTQTYDLPVSVDRPAMEIYSIPFDTSVTVDAKDVTLGDALQRMLDQVGMVWTIQHEALLVTSKDRAAELFSIRLYDVTDLVVALDEEGKLWADFEGLIDAITTSIDPASWADVGGMGTIHPVTAGGARVLVISQAYHTHRRIARLLAALRRIATTRKDAAGIPRRNPQAAVSCQTPGPVCTNPGCRMDGIGGMGGEAGEKSK